MFAKDSNRKMFLIIFILIGLILLTGCSSEKPTQNNTAIRIGFTGKVCEAPLFAALCKDFFNKGKIKVELIKVNDTSLKQKLASGEIDGVTADYSIFKEIENGLNVKLVAGLNSECMQLLTLKGSNIGKISDLKNRTIGTTDKGNGHMTVLSMLLQSEQIQPWNDVHWKFYKENDLEKALKNGEVDVICGREPAKDSEIKDNHEFDIIYKSSTDTGKGSYKHFYTGFIGLNGALIEKHPKTAVEVSVAWLTAAQWVADHPEEAMKLTLEKGYVQEDYETVKKDFYGYMWMPGVKYLENHAKAYIGQQKNHKILSPGIDEKVLLKKSISKIIPDLNGR